MRAGRSRVLIMSLRSGAGIDGRQDVVSTLVFGELDWSPGPHKQAIRRARRPGQPKRCRAYFGTTDPRIGSGDARNIGRQKHEVTGADRRRRRRCGPAAARTDDARAVRANQTTGFPRRGASRSGIDGEEDRMSTEPLPPLGSTHGDVTYMPAHRFGIAAGMSGWGWHAVDFSA